MASKVNETDPVLVPEAEDDTSRHELFVPAIVNGVVGYVGAIDGSDGLDGTAQGAPAASWALPTNALSWVVELVVCCAFVLGILVPIEETTKATARVPTVRITATSARSLDTPVLDRSIVVLPLRFIHSAVSNKSCRIYGPG